MNGDAPRVLLPQDGSELSAWAIDRAEDLLRRPGASATLLGVVEAPPELAADLAYRVDPRHAEFEGRLRERRDRLRAKGVAAEAELRFGDPAEAILREIREGRHDLAVLSTHGRGGLARVLMGSVAGKVLQGSTIPLLLFRPLQTSDGELSPAAGQGPALVRRILVLLDGSPASTEIVKPVVDLARLLDARLVLFTAVPKGPEAELRRRAAEEELARWSRLLSAAGLRTSIDVRPGNAVRAAEEAALETGADLVALTTRGGTGPLRALAGGLTERVLADLGLPLLVARSRGPAAAAPTTAEAGPVVHVT